jgi:hypothetical protein
VLASGPRFRGFKAEEDGFFKSDEDPYHYSFGGEVKPSAPCSKILRHLKEPSAV